MWHGLLILHKLWSQHADAGVETDETMRNQAIEKSWGGLWTISGHGIRDL